MGNVLIFTKQPCENSGHHFEFSNILNRAALWMATFWQLPSMTQDRILWYELELLLDRSTLDRWLFKQWYIVEFYVPNSPHILQSILKYCLKICSIIWLNFYPSHWLSGNNSECQVACPGSRHNADKNVYRASLWCDTLQPRTAASSCNLATLRRLIELEN